MRQTDKDFTYEFNIIYMVEPVLGKTLKMFNKYWLINVLIRKHPSTWVAATLHAEHACFTARVPARGLARESDDVDTGLHVNNGVLKSAHQTEHRTPVEMAGPF